MPRSSASVIHRRCWRDPFWIILLVVPPLLIFANLGASILWQDEAQTALLARSVLVDGLPRAEDQGRPIGDQLDGADVSEDGLWIWTPWLPYYVTAASFAALGESTLAARLPFALLGWLTLLLGYPAIAELTGDRRTARLAVILLATSVPYLLLVRQCRYYALLSLLGLLHWWSYLRLEHRSWRVGFALVGAGLAHSFPPQLAVSGGATLAHALLVRRDGRLVGRVVAGLLVSLTLALPYLLYARFWERDYQGAGFGMENWLRYAATLRAYAVEVHLYAWPFVLAIPALWRLLGRAGGPRTAVARLILVLGSGLAFLTLAAPPSRFSFALLLGGALVAASIGLWYLIREGSSRWSRVADGTALALIASGLGAVVLSAIAPFPFFRYWVGLLPLLAVLTARALLGLDPRRPALAWGVAAALVCSNLLQIGPLVVAHRALAAAGLDSTEDLAPRTEPGHGPANDLARTLLRRGSRDGAFGSAALDYIHELTHDYEGPVEGVIRHLEAHAQPGEVILTSHAHFPLLFYTDLRVVRPHQIESLASPPDWILERAHLASGRHSLSAAWRGAYVRELLPYRDLPWDNIPEPYWHRYRTVESGARVALLRRRSQP